uniref:Multidrug resistance-associated protein 5 n=1 Tax=Tanacetum cinerariifolium TaxID=118510 RepID=A0A6L2M0X7_TANCI|nr:multidrug resistance-associated protein 5 [Tanacetum cinerariifolium]
MPVDNVRGETFDEHGIYMNELLKRLKTTDDDGITKDPFIFVEQHMERLVKKYEKTVGKHYAMLRSYGKAILDSNSGSIVKLGVIVNPEDKTYIDRFYVCFTGLVDGWKIWCKKITSLDGCFMKSPYQGEIITTIGRDGNNHIYLVAWAVVNVENKDK